jgi:hypothetical protein
MENAALLEAIRLATRKELEPRLLEVDVKLYQGEDLTPAETVLLADFEQSQPPLLTEGKPTVIRTAAWLNHASEDSTKPYINANRLAFVKAELDGAAGKISAVNPLVMDWNHSATRGSLRDDPKVVGVWTHAEVAFDTKASAWGILAGGVMFSWLFPDLGDAMLAEQARHGHVRVSMACLSGSIETTEDADGNPYEIAHNPTFFTLSALDVPAADPHAVGRAAETGDPATGDKLRAELLAADEVAAKQLTVKERLHALLAAAAQPTEDTTMEIKELEEKLIESKVASQAEHDRLTAQITSLMTEATNTKATGEVREAELVTARDAALSELEKANAEIARVATELEVVQTKLAEYEAKEAAKAKGAVVEARMLSLPEAFTEALKGRTEEVRARFAAKIAGMSDEDFEFYKNEELGIAGMKVSYANRTANEGVLPTGGGNGATIAERLARHKK